MDAEQTRQAALAADRDLAASTTDFALQAAIAANRPDLVDALALNTSLYADLRTWVDEQLAGSAVQASELRARAAAPGRRSDLWSRDELTCARLGDPRHRRTREPEQWCSGGRAHLRRRGSRAARGGYRARA